MKLKDLPASPTAMKALQILVKERLYNVELLGNTPGVVISKEQALIGEICVMGAKLDAFMQMFEDRETDFSKFNEYVERAAIAGTENAKVVRNGILSSLQAKG